MGFWLRTRQGRLAAGAALVVLVGGTSVASAADTTTAPAAYKGCLSTANGTLYNVVDDPAATPSCRPGDLLINWNQQGVPGAVGPQGPAGPVGPAGAEGRDGAQGAVGPQGPAGLNGQDGAPGPQGAAGQQGPAGTSAYQTWLSTGHTGTEADFLASLQGVDGRDGATGPAGPAGPQGDVGPQGPKGDTGDAGPQGPAGPQGVSGRVLVTSAEVTPYYGQASTYVLCPIGKLAVGGGAEVTQTSGGNGPFLSASSPYGLEGVGWFARANAPSDFAYPWGLKVYAICVDRPTS